MLQAERGLLVFVPWRGVGCFLPQAIGAQPLPQGFRPLAGCGLFLYDYQIKGFFKEFPSPYGAWVVSGVTMHAVKYRDISVPLWGVGCFTAASSRSTYAMYFRPLAGCGLFRDVDQCSFGFKIVSVPLRGVGCFFPPVF